MARIYTNTSVVGAGLNGLYEGLKDAEDEKFRNAEQSMKAEQFAAERYLKARRNKAGGYGGLDIDEEKIDRDTPIAEAKYPEYFSKTTQEASPEVFSNETDLRARAMQDLAPQTPPVQAPPPAPAPQPIQPLLKSKESSRQESDMAMAKGDQEVKAKIAEGNKPVSLGKEQYTGTEAGVDKFEQPVNTNVSFDEGMTYAAPKEEVKERFRPSNIAMTNIMAGLGNKEANSDPQIPMTSLPPEVKKLMGIAPEFQGSLRSSIVKELIQAGSKTAAGVAIRPQVQEGIDLVREGKSTPAAVARMIPDLTKAESDKLNQAAYQSTSQTGTNTRAEKIATRQERREINAIKRGTQKDMYSAFKGEIDEIQAARTLRKLAGQKNTAGSEALIATLLLRMSGQASNSISDRDMKSMGGVTGWGNMVEQFAAKAAGEGLTPANKKRALELADVFDKAAKKIIRSKSGFLRRSAISQLESYYDDPAQAESEVDRALDVDALLSGFDDDEKPAASSGGGKSSGLSSEQKNQLKSVATQKLQEVNSSGLGGAEKAKKIEKIMQWYAKEAGQQYTSKVE